MSAQEHDMFCGPDESELKFESDFSNDQKLEVNAEIKTEKWEIEAEQWANLDDEACEFFFPVIPSEWLIQILAGHAQLQLSRKRPSGSDQEERKKHKSSNGLSVQKQCESYLLTPYSRAH
jgi:hypothetical protein